MRWLPCRLAQGQPFLQDAEDRLGHGLWSPGLERAALSKAQVVHQALVGVPALLPHRLQLILIAVCFYAPRGKEKKQKKHSVSGFSARRGRRA